VATVEQGGMTPCSCRTPIYSRRLRIPVTGRRSNAASALPKQICAAVGNRPLIVSELASSDIARESGGFARGSYQSDFFKKYSSLCCRSVAGTNWYHIKLGSPWPLDSAKPWRPMGQVPLLGRSCLRSFSWADTRLRLKQRSTEHPQPQDAGKLMPKVHFHVLPTFT
jgi:hypothetical protein